MWCVLMNSTLLLLKLPLIILSFQLQLLCFIKPTNLLCAVCICVSSGYLLFFCIFKEICLFPLQKSLTNLPITPQFGVGLYTHVYLHDGILTGFILHKFYACWYNCSKFMCATFLCIWKILFPCMHLSSLGFTIHLSLFCDDLWAVKTKIWYKCHI